MERRLSREPSESRGPGGQPGTPEKATVTQRVLIVMEGRSITTPSPGTPEDTGLGGPKSEGESQGPPRPKSTPAVLDLGPAPSKYTGTESQGPLIPENSTTVPDLGPLPPQHVLKESQGAPPPGGTTIVPDLGPLPPQYTTLEIQGPTPPAITTSVPDLGPLPPQYAKLEICGPPPPGSTASVPDLGPPPVVQDQGPVTLQHTTENQGPPLPGSTRGVQNVEPLPPPYAMTEGRAMVTNGGARHLDEWTPPPRDSPRKAPQIRPVWVIPRKAPEATPLGGNNTGLEPGTSLPPGEESAIQSSGTEQKSPDTPILSALTLSDHPAIPPMCVQDNAHQAQGAMTTTPLEVPTPIPEPPSGGHNKPSVSMATIGPPQNSLPPNISTPTENMKIVQNNVSAPPPQDTMTPPAVTSLPRGRDKASPSEQNSTPPAAQPAPSGSSLSPSRINDSSSPHRSMSSKPPLPIPPRSALYPGHAPSLRDQEPSFSHDSASLSSFRSKAPAPDTLSYLDSVSLMSGTLESLTHLDDASSLGSDSEINGMPYRKTDKYGFLGGTQYSGNGEHGIPVEIARQRELKWLDMFNHWDKWLSRRFQKVKLRCRKGIPSSLRARAWQYLSNSQELLNKNPGKFEELEREPGDPKWLDVIEKDLHRQFPFHEMFAARGGHGQQDLYRILKAYTVYRPEEGYCQAQAPVAAVLLMHMPAEQAFWCLVQICDKYLPGYYSAGLEAIQLDGEIFFALLRRVCPMAYRHLKKFKIDPILYMTEWFMCIFSRTLPWSSVLRVWDMFFCEGVKIIFRVGLVLLRHTLGSVDKLRSCQGMYETMEKLRSLPPTCMQEEILLPEVSSLPVTDALIERESNTQLRKWRENRGELQYRPSRRLHGARQISEEKLRLNPALSGSRLSLSSLRRPSPPASPALTLQPESVVVSEGLHPVLPSPTANKAPLGPPKEAAKKNKEKQKEQDKKKEKEEREREKRREKEEREERERERRREKEREKQREKEEKRLQKEKEKTEAKQKKERKISFRRKEASSPSADPTRKSATGSADGTAAAAHDTYF